MTETEEEIMLQIQNTLVSLDLAERFFCCDLDSCLGECCIEGDAGAPITEEEKKRLEEILPVVWDDLLPAARREIEENGVAYTDEEGDLVTSIVDGRNCVFTTLRHRESLPRRQDRLSQACVLPSIPRQTYRISEFHRSQLSPLEDMQMRRDTRPQKGHTALSVP